MLQSTVKQNVSWTKCATDQNLKSKTNRSFHLTAIPTTTNVHTELLVLSSAISLLSGQQESEVKCKGWIKKDKHSWGTLMKSWPDKHWEDKM